MAKCWRLCSTSNEARMRWTFRSRTTNSQFT